MTPAFEKLVQVLKRLPGLGYRSAERAALHLLAEKPERAKDLLEALGEAAARLGRCPVCGNLAEDGEPCGVCVDPTRREDELCVVESVLDLAAMERAGVYRGRYHVLHGKLSPVNDLGPEELSLGALRSRLEEGAFTEIILALSNDIEGEATCHYIQEETLAGVTPLPRLSRIGFGLPSGGGVVYADATTLKSALEARRAYE